MTSEHPLPTRPLVLAVAGGTGVVGRHVVAQARARDHRVVVLSRAEGVDLLSGERLETVLEGVDAVIDVTSTHTQRTADARAFFGTVTRNLLAAEDRAGVGHHVALSIVGIDRATSGYYAGKLLQERLLAETGDRWTLLRATQFHEFAAQIRDTVSFGPLALVPRMRSQPVAADEVAARLVELAEAGPAGRVNDLGGPREESMASMVRRYLRASGQPGRVVTVPLPGSMGRLMRDGSLLAGPGADHGRLTFDAWLAAEHR